MWIPERETSNDAGIERMREFYHPLKVPQVLFAFLWVINRALADRGADAGNPHVIGVQHILRTFDIVVVNFGDVFAPHAAADFDGIRPGFNAEFDGFLKIGFGNLVSKKTDINHDECLRLCYLSVKASRRKIKATTIRAATTLIHVESFSNAGLPAESSSELRFPILV